MCSSPLIRLKEDCSAIMISARGVMIKKATITALIMVGCLTASSAFSWGPLGHRAICDVAWRAGDTVTKAKLAASAKRMGYKTFATACLWADHVRNKKRYDYLKPLHYMNVSRKLVRISRNSCRDAHLKKPRCVLSAINYYENRWRDKTLSQRQRDEALLLMSHFVGDIHQPLHVSFRDDRGGTLRRVIFEGKVISLHRLWDSNLLRCKGDTSWRKLGQNLHHQLRGQKALELSPLIWAQESYEITQRLYQNIKRPLAKSYCSEFNGIAVERLAMAGLRLSAMLSKPR